VYDIFLSFKKENDEGCNVLMIDSICCPSCCYYFINNMPSFVNGSMCFLKDTTLYIVHRLVAVKVRRRRRMVILGVESSFYQSRKQYWQWHAARSHIRYSTRRGRIRFLVVAHFVERVSFGYSAQRMNPNFFGCSTVTHPYTMSVEYKLYYTLRVV
jgi:hypothetical protein